jgi:hypothetical protein
MRQMLKTRYGSRLQIPLAVIGYFCSAYVWNHSFHTAEPMIEITNMVLTSEHLVENHARQSFVAWKHPCGGEGLVAGWSAKR